LRFGKDLGPVGPERFNVEIFNDEPQEFLDRNPAGGTVRPGQLFAAAAGARTDV